MKRDRVASASIASIGYEKDSKVLEIELKHGGVYQYFDVGHEVYSDLLEAASVGRYYTKYVRNVYRFRKVK